MKMKESSKINYEKRPLPSSPGAAQITVEGQEAKKGGAPLVSKLPEKNLVKGPK